jgi:hypothetical protein
VKQCCLASGPPARTDAFEFQIRHLLGRESVCQEIQDIAHPNAYPANTGTAPALLLVNRNAIYQLSHKIFLLCKRFESNIAVQNRSTTP